MLSMFLVALIQAASPTPAIDCAQPQTASFAINSAAQALRKRDYAGAAAAVSPLVAACGPNTRPGGVGRLLAAEAASGLGDWKTVLDDVKDLDFASVPRFYARTQFLRMGAYAALKDEADFAAARTRLLAAENQALAKLGPMVERFDVGAYHVTVYRAPVTQGGFVRMIEFIVEPTAPFVFPQSVMLTEDKATAGLSKALGLQSNAPGLKIYFVDMYNCARHMTLKQVQAKDGAAPAYDEVKPLVVSALSSTSKWESSMSPGGACLTSQWITPGLAH